MEKKNIGHRPEQQYFEENVTDEVWVRNPEGKMIQLDVETENQNGDTETGQQG